MTRSSFISACIFKLQESAGKSNLYEVHYTDGPCSGKNLPLIDFLPPSTATVFDVMKLALDEHGCTYQFQATYHGDAGYEITSLNGHVKSSNCTWNLYTQGPYEGNQPMKALISVSRYIPCDSVFSVMRYEAYSKNQLSVEYSIEYDPVCSSNSSLDPVIVGGLEPGTSTALDVMEGAVTNSTGAAKSRYEFLTTYCGTGGFLIDSINGTPNRPGRCCYWVFYHQAPGEQPVADHTSVSKYKIPGDGYTIIMRYTKAQEAMSCSTLRKPKKVPN